MFLDKFIHDLPINLCFTRTNFSTISYESIPNRTQNPVHILHITHNGEAIDNKVYNNMNVKQDCSHSHGNINNIWCPRSCPNDTSYTTCFPCWTFLTTHGFEPKTWNGRNSDFTQSIDSLFLLLNYQLNDCHLLWRKYEYSLLVAQVHKHTISLLIYRMSLILFIYKRQPSNLHNKWDVLSHSECIVCWDQHF